MFPTLFDSTTIPILEQVLSFSEARHHVLAGNIANGDTPGYRVRDLSVDVFQQRLKEAIAAREKGPHYASWTDVGRVDDEMKHVREAIKSIDYLDGSNVGIEQQVAEVAKNQFLHNLTVSIMTSQFRLLQTAISERV